MLAGLVRVSVCFVIVNSGAGVGIGTVDPGLVGTTKVVADSKAYTVEGAVRERCPSVPHPMFECTEAEHELRYVFSSVRYSIFGGPLRGDIVYSGMLEMMLSIVLPYVDMMPVWWCGLSPVWGLSPVVISSNGC